MICEQEWRAISERIDGLQRQSAPLVSAFSKRGDDGTGSGGLLIQRIRATTELLTNFSIRYQAVLPSAVITAINSYSTGPAPNYVPSDPLANLTSNLTGLLAIRDEIIFLMADTGAVIRRQSERAFLHLQQCIVANSDVRRQWQLAFDTPHKGEPECEKLGAAHLLLHGIYAFKANAEGGRTDLVFPDRPVIDSEVTRVSHALVLTEWKRITSDDNPDTKAGEARTEAALYRLGLLCGFELANYVYVILVSSDWLHPLNDIVERDRTYRHINIAVAPSTPSVAARKHML